MYYVLESANFEVRALSRMRDDFTIECPCMDYLEQRCARGDPAPKGFRALFRRYAALGRAGMTHELLHEANKEEKIWEFVKGDHRVFCFMHENAIVITHAAMKKGQRADPLEVKKAIAARTEYSALVGRKK